MCLGEWHGGSRRCSLANVLASADGGCTASNVSTVLSGHDFCMQAGFREAGHGTHLADAQGFLQYALVLQQLVCPAEHLHSITISADSAAN